MAGSTAPSQPHRFDRLNIKPIILEQPLSFDPGLHSTTKSNYPVAQMNPVTISRYQDTIHRSQVILLWETVFHYDTPHNRASLVIDKKLAVQDELFFVALSNSHVVGTIMAGYDGHRGWIYSVAISSSHRRQGIGSQLVSHAESALIRKGAVKINLQIIEGNESVSAFYSSLGFRIEKRVSMGKPIAQNIPA